MWLNPIRFFQLRVYNLQKLGPSCCRGSLLVPRPHFFGSVFACTLKEGADHQNGPPSNRAIFLHITNSTAYFSAITMDITDPAIETYSPSVNINTVNELVLFMVFSCQAKVSGMRLQFAPLRLGRFSRPALPTLNPVAPKVIPSDTLIDEENIPGYDRDTFYHPNSGDVLNYRYELKAKIGWGSSSLPTHAPIWRMAASVRGGKDGIVAVLIAAEPSHCCFPLLPPILFLSRYRVAEEVQRHGLLGSV